MIPWEEIDRITVSKEGEELVLRRRDQEFSIRIGGTELMNSRVHGSEDDLARLAFKRLKKRRDIKVLIGGLGMGYTLGAALGLASPDSVITVSELVPAVVQWNLKHLGHLAGHPLADPRVRVEPQDVARVMAGQQAAWDIILLDVDNGPAGLTQKSNDRLYGRAGLGSAFWALNPGGVLGVWSAGPDEAFTRCLSDSGFKAESVLVRAGKRGKGGRHTIWLARKP